jgi:hypothetical protein
MDVTRAPPPSFVVIAWRLRRGETRPDAVALSDRQTGLTVDHLPIAANHLWELLT